MIEPLLPSNEVERLKSLASLNVLDTHQEERFDRITKIAQHIFSVPIVLVSLVDSHRQWFKSFVGLSVVETPRSVSFCGHAILSDGPFIIEDALADLRFKDNPLVVNDPFIRFYAGIPLSGPGGYRVGSFCLLDIKPRSLTPAEINTLKGLARWIELELNYGELSTNYANSEILKSHFELAVNGSRVGIWDWMDVNKKEQWWSKEFYQLLGFRSNEIAASSESFKDLLHPDDRQVVMTMFEKHFSKGSPFETELRLKTKKQGYLWFMGRGQVINGEDGKTKRMTGTIIDIHAKKSLEEQLQVKNKKLEMLKNRLKVATSSAKIGVWDWDIVTNSLVWDEQMYKVVGVDPKKFTGVYEAWENIVHPDDKQKAVSEVQEAIAGKKEFDTQFRIIWPDQSIHWIKACGLLIRDDQGKPLHMIGVNWDITESVIANQKIMAASEAKSNFLANMSHEIRTPLNSILGFTYLMMQTALDDKQQEYLEIISSGGKFLVGIIDNILDLSNLEAGKIKLESIDFNLELLITEALKEISPRIKDKEIHTFIEFDERLRGLVKGDPARLKQIILNLLDHANKFTQQGEIGIIVKLDPHKSSQEDLAIRFIVRDSGIGIPADQIATIFQAFPQDSNLAAKRFGGTSLGLNIAKLLVSIKGGQMWVESEEGKGSDFIFDIHLKKGAATAHH